MEILMTLPNRLDVDDTAEPTNERDPQAEGRKFVFPVMSMDGIEPFTVEELEGVPKSSLNAAADAVAMILGEPTVNLRKELEREVFDYDDQQSVNWQVCIFPATPSYGPEGPGTGDLTLPRGYVFRNIPGTDDYIMVKMVVFPDEYWFERRWGNGFTAEHIVDELNAELQNKQEVEAGVGFDKEAGRWLG